MIYVMLVSGCLKSGLEELQNSDAKELTAVDYNYRFLYTDTIKKGEPSQEIQKDRVCEVLFKKVTTRLTENGVTVLQTTLTHDGNSVLKAGPTGSVTRAMLYEQFKQLIQTDQLTKLWASTTISLAAKITPVGDAPELGKPGNFSKDATYQVSAANGTTTNYILRTVKGF